MTSDPGYIEFRYYLNDPHYLIDPPYDSSHELIHKQDIVIRTDDVHLNVFQYFNLFQSFLRAISFDNFDILRGAASIVFSEFTSDKDLEKLSKEFDFTPDFAEPPLYLTKEEKKVVNVYLEEGQLESDTFSLKEIEILDIARNMIKDQQDKIKEQEEIIEEWVKRYNKEWSDS